LQLTEIMFLQLALIFTMAMNEQWILTEDFKTQTHALQSAYLIWQS
jgi:hypothetical protein